MSGQIAKHQVARLVTDYKVDGSTALPVKILDINEDDTANHTCDISAHVPPSTKAIFIYWSRVSGTGTLTVYSNSATTASGSTQANMQILPIINQQIKYAQSAGGDDFDLFLHGYVVEGPVGK